jgi:hypothetical protein
MVNDEGGDEGCDEDILLSERVAGKGARGTALLKRVKSISFTIGSLFVVDTLSFGSTNAFL